MKRGFTLVELMVVIAVLGIIAALAVPNFRRARASVYRAEMKRTLTLIYQLEHAFYAEHGHYGPGTEDLTNNSVRYPPYTDTFYIKYPPNNLDLIMDPEHRYYYYIYWEKEKGREYFIAGAVASRRYGNDIDGDDEIDWWYVSSSTPQPTAIRDDLQ